MTGIKLPTCPTCNGQMDVQNLCGGGASIYCPKCWKGLDLSIDKENSKPLEPQVADSVAATLVQRGSRYGDFSDHAEVCQDLKEVMISAETKAADGRVIFGWSKLSNVQKQALEVIADKIARILTGDPNYDDNWHDIQGYAKLVEDRLPKKGDEK